ncbi:hypothetical protein AB4305_15295 [Nocardia sp. 2YAB30]|uniref:hypothetical protein n=1 Tax=unclassified Nocardia TaxID=2637762 RepID=UPI003F94B622
MSLCANIAAAPELNVFAVAACPPLALLLSVELLNHALKQHRAETGREPVDETTETEWPPRLVVVSGGSRHETSTAEQKMWAHYCAERAEGRTPTGAKLDRIAGTNNYGRRVLRRRWRESGRITGAGLPPSRVRSAPNAHGSSELLAR